MTGSVKYIIYFLYINNNNTQLIHKYHKIFSIKSMILNMLFKKNIYIYIHQLNGHQHKSLAKTTRTRQILCCTDAVTSFSPTKRWHEWMNEAFTYIALYCVLLYTQSALQSYEGVSLQPPPVCSIHLDDATAATGQGASALTTHQLQVERRER